MYKKPNSRNYTSTAIHLAIAWSNVSCAKVTVRHFGTNADMSGQFGTAAEVSYVRQTDRLTDRRDRTHYRAEFLNDYK